MTKQTQITERVSWNKNNVEYKTTIFVKFYWNTVKILILFTAIWKSQFINQNKYISSGLISFILFTENHEIVLKLTKLVILWTYPSNIMWQ